MHYVVASRFCPRKFWPFARRRQVYYGFMQLKESAAMSLRCIALCKTGACCINACQGCHALQLHGKGRLVLHKSIATLLGLANKAEICGAKFGPASSAQVCGISVSVTVSILS